jgi:hypothetical protein
MSNLTKEIKNLIIEKRPKLSEQSIKTYTSILKNLYENIFGDEHQNVRTSSNNFDKLHVKNFEKTDKILDYLHQIPSNRRKTVLSALVIITDNDAYRKVMLNDIHEYNTEQSKQVQNDKQQSSWLDNEEIKEIFNKLERMAKILYKEPKLNMNELQEIQNYIILCLLGGIYIPPRRSKDYVDFKISNINKDKDNYLDKRKLIFNSYKTAKTYGKQELEIPIQLQKILKKWISINPTEYLLFDSHEHQLSNIKLTQRLNKLFDKKASVNQLRHTYLSNKYQSTIEQNKKMNEDFKNMGSSMAQQKVYIKSNEV